MNNSIDNLSEFDRLLYEIGRVCQSQVNLERGLRDVYVVMNVPSLGMHLSTSVQGVAKLKENCTQMLKKADIPKDIIEAGLLTLRDAYTADKLRHRVIHDWWTSKMPDDFSPKQFVKYKLSKATAGYTVTHEDLDYVISVTTSLQRSIYRVHALHWALIDTLPFWKQAGIAASFSLNDWIAVMKDEFDIQPDGGFKPRINKDGGNWNMS